MSDGETSRLGNAPIRKVIISFCYDTCVQRYFYQRFTVAGSREQSYVYALAAAALTQSIAKACSSGASAKCSCGPLPNEPPPGQFKWGGCGDDVGFGVIFSKWFTDTPWNKKRTSKRHLVNIHNNAVGRQVYFSTLIDAWSLVTVSARVKDVDASVLCQHSAHMLRPRTCQCPLNVVLCCQPSSFSVFPANRVPNVTIS